MIIHEVAVKKIIPFLKGVLVYKLYGRGFSQRRIASLFSISQPQVHKYLSKPLEFYYKILEHNGFSREQINRFIELLVELASRGEYVRFNIVFSTIVDYLAKQYICTHDKRFYEYCYGISRIIDPFILEYEDALKRILSIKKLYRLIPEVGSNLVYAPRIARDINDVIGLPGRIVRIGQNTVALGQPIYGGSRHTASILIIAQKYNPVKHVAMNIKYIGNIDELFNKTYRILKCGPHDRDLFWENIEKCLSSKPDILCDEGGHGLEPVIYIIAKDFDELINLIKQLV